MGGLQGQHVLVTGATGFVGTNLVQRLVEQGVRVRGTRHQRPVVFEHEAVSYVDCDLTRMADCQQAVEGVDVIFHCAASTSGAAVISQTPLVHVTPNIVMNAQLLEAACAAGVKRFVWLSSSTGYPPTGDRPVREDEMMTGDPYDKYYFVGWMKRFTEILCRMYGERLAQPMTTVVLRPTNIYGEFDDYDFATSHVFAALIRRVVERHDPIEVWGTGDDVRDLIYVQDFVDAMLLAAERCQAYAVYNIGLGEGTSVKELLKMICEQDGYTDAEIRFDPGKPTMIPVRMVDIRKASAELGFQPKTDIRTGIQKTLNWYRTFCEKTAA